jgi:predicted RNA-binding protein
LLEKSEAKTHWLLVERLDNWQIDRLGEFQQFGLPNLRRKLGKQIKRGDLLIFYVSSGISSFADVREAVEDGVSKLGIEGDYDRPYPWRVKTKPILTLPRERWVPIKPLVPSLTLTAGVKEWRQCMRTSLRRLKAADAALIMDAMRHAAAMGKE